MTQVRQAQVHRLVQLSLDDQGRLSSQRIADVMTGLGAVTIPGKSELRRAYARRIRHLAGQQVAIVTSAIDLDANLKLSIQRQISERHPSVAMVEWQLEPELVGGMTILAADTWYDLSLRGKLQTIEEQLAS